MFRHIGKRRTYSQNLKLASLLSMIAGIVNVTGVLAFGVLTTNVTGHFAYFAEDLLLTNYYKAFLFFGYIMSFLFGSFTSNFIMELAVRKHKLHSYTIPISCEVILLAAVAFNEYLPLPVHILPFIMLFAMGIQNSLVTFVSNSVVRTTHLTGLFTDLGIVLSQMIFHRDKALGKSLFLKMAIITSFFIGCLLGGFWYMTIKIKILLIAIFLLLLALGYDKLLMQYYHLRKKYHPTNN